MQKSIYTPLSGALAQERVMEIISNNLANVNTTGFKGDRVTFKLLESEPERNYQNPLPPANFKMDFEELQNLRGNSIGYVGIAQVARDTSQGSSIKTGNKTDVMIEGKGMLKVMTPDGERYTRDGSLMINREGILVTKQGHPVIGEKGDIGGRAAFPISHSGF